MTCPKCGELLQEDNIDDRTEWTEISYYCQNCNKTYLRRIDYQTQSRLVKLDRFIRRK